MGTPQEIHKQRAEPDEEIMSILRTGQGLSHPDIVDIYKKYNLLPPSTRGFSRDVKKSRLELGNPLGVDTIRYHERIIYISAHLKRDELNLTEVKRRIDERLAEPPKKRFHSNPFTDDEA